MHIARSPLASEVPFLTRARAPAIYARARELESFAPGLLPVVEEWLPVIEPHLDEILERFDDIEPHLPFVIDHIDQLAPHCGPLLKHMDVLLACARALPFSRPREPRRRTRARANAPGPRPCPLRARPASDADEDEASPRTILTQIKQVQQRALQPNTSSS